MFVLSRIVSWCLRVGLPLAALGLHLVIVVTYARRWDHAAALTVFPFWAWGLLGLSMSLIAWIIGRKRFALGMTLLWLVTTIAGSDETRPCSDLEFRSRLSACRLMKKATAFCAWSRSTATT